MSCCRVICVVVSAITPPWLASVVMNFKRGHEGAGSFLLSSHLPLLPFLLQGSYFPSFLVISISRCDCASEAVTSQCADLCAHIVFPLDAYQPYFTFVLSAWRPRCCQQSLNLFCRDSKIFVNPAWSVILTHSVTMLMLLCFHHDLYRTLCPRVHYFFSRSFCSSPFSILFHHGFQEPILSYLKWRFLLTKEARVICSPALASRALPTACFYARTLKFPCQLGWWQ